MGVNRLFRAGTMRVRAVIILLLLCGHALSGYSQKITVEKSERIEKIDGKQYYIHTVEKGQTLYSISKAYGVLISEIFTDNPIAMDGIQPDQELKIIVKKEAEVIEVDTEYPIIDGNMIYHKVRPKDTLYSLAKHYGVTMEEIRELNVELISEDLKIGSVLKIPQRGSKEESVPENINQFQVRDTVYPPGTMKESYNVVYMLPLFLEMNDTIEARVSDMEPDRIYEEAMSGIEFYQGAQLALDSLKANGLSAEVYVYDSESNTSRVRNLFYKPEVKNADIIIGPFYKELFTIAQQLSNFKGTPVVSPVLADPKILEGKTSSAKVTVSEETEIKKIAEYISSEFCNENVLVIHKGKEKELERLAWFESVYRCDSSNWFTPINYKSSGWDSLSSSLSMADTNIVVVLSDDQSFVTSFFITLDKKKEDYPMRVFGIRSWLDFENIETDYYHDMHLHLPVQDLINYEDSSVVWFVKNYRERFKNEPGYFAFLGFDVTYYFLSSIQKFGVGTDYLDKLSIYNWLGLQNSFRFERNGWETGVENKAVHIAKYKDYKLQKVY